MPEVRRKKITKIIWIIIYIIALISFAWVYGYKKINNERQIFAFHNAVIFLQVLHASQEVHKAQYGVYSTSKDYHTWDSRLSLAITNLESDVQTYFEIKIENLSETKWTVLLIPKKKFISISQIYIDQTGKFEFEEK